MAHKKLPHVCMFPAPGSDEAEQIGGSKLGSSKSVNVISAIILGHFMDLLFLLSTLPSFFGIL